MEQKSLPRFQDIPPFRPTCTDGYVVKVVDGDTVHFAFFDEWAQGFVRICCRLSGLDTAELHSKDPEEKEAAQAAKQHLNELIQDEPLCVELEPRADKYGRWLATFRRSRDQLNINEAMLASWAVPYDGKKKAKIDWGLKLRSNRQDVSQGGGEALE